MGGQLFGQGNRLTTAQLYTFEAHCKTKWSAHFDVIKTLIPLKDKATHGDLDLAVAWSRLRDHTAGKGLERGELNKQGEEVISDFTLVDKKRGDNVVGFEGDKGEDGFDFKAFIRQLVKEVGGRKWQRQGWQLFVEVPCKEIPGINLDEVLPLEGETQNAEPIYQLDIMMIHTASIDFDMFATSYRSTLRILSASIRNLSRSVSLHQTFLALRHLAYPGLRPVELVFTNSAEEFCDWVGLDYRFWKENHFANQTVFWEWLSDVEEDSILGKAYTRLVRGLDIPHKKKYKLKDTDWSEFKQYLHDKSKFAKYALSPDELAAKMESIALRDQEKQEEELVNPSFVDPNSPVPLDLLAKAALVRWDLVEDYEKELRQRKEEAMMLCFRQKKNPVKLLLPTAPTDGSSASVTDPLSKAADENVPPAPAKKGDVTRVLVAEVDKGSQGGSSSG